MSEQEYRIEKCGGLLVYHPIIKKPVPAPEYTEWFNAEWEGVEKYRREQWDSSYAEHLREMRAA